jgi:hypothetical protein
MKSAADSASLADFSNEDVAAAEITSGATWAPKLI